MAVRTLVVSNIRIRRNVGLAKNNIWKTIFLFFFDELRKNFPQNDIKLRLYCTFSVGVPVKYFSHSQFQSKFFIVGALCTAIQVTLKVALKIMFPSSTQIKHWTFSSEAEITKYREEANAKFVAKHGAQMSVRRCLRLERNSNLKT